MTEELGFRTPAKEAEKLRKRLEQMEGLGEGVIDAVKLSLGALIEIFTDRVISNPKDARKIKDNLLDKVKEAGVSQFLIDVLDDNLKARCDMIDKFLSERSR